MDKRVAGLLGAAAALTAVNGAQATPLQPGTVPVPTSYRELLEPIPNAVAALNADNAARTDAGPSAGVELVQWHHHHHHHHHHHNNAFIGGVVGGVIGGLLAPRPACYWTLGRPYWNGYRWIRPRVQVCP
jgi:hypothetical protein